MRITICLAACLLSAQVQAACPTLDAEELDGRQAPLFAKLKAAKTEVEGQILASALWEIFSTAPDKKAQELLDKGVQSIGRGEFLEAETALTYLIDYCPEYAEGWNQRAFARYLKGEYDEALADLDRTLELAPRHFGALAGRGLTLLRQGRQVLGQRAIREALDVHPWLSERHLLPPDQKI